LKKPFKMPNWKSCPDAITVKVDLMCINSRVKTREKRIKTGQVKFKPFYPFLFQGVVGNLGDKLTNTVPRQEYCIQKGFWYIVR
jgi:hypothetical protein